MQPEIARQEIAERIVDRVSFLVVKNTFEQKQSVTALDVQRFGDILRRVDGADFGLGHGQCRFAAMDQKVQDGTGEVGFQRSRTENTLGEDIHQNATGESPVRITRRTWVSESPGVTLSFLAVFSLA